MGEVNFSVLRDASPAMLFHLQNGMDIGSVRELALLLLSLPKDVFSHHVNKKKNDFAVWIEDVFGDTLLANKLKKASSRAAMARIIEEHILDLEEQELKKFGVVVPLQKLRPLEQYVQEQLFQKVSSSELRDRLQRKGVSKQLSEFIIESVTSFLREVKSITTLKNMDVFHHELERFKRYVMSAIAHGATVEQIQDVLSHQGWNKEVIEFLFYDVFKPHPNVKKLSLYILHCLRDKHEDIAVIKKRLLHLGWKEYIVESVLYGINDSSTSIAKILAYLGDFSVDEQERVKGFLLHMGWEEVEVTKELQKRRFHVLNKRLKQVLKTDSGKNISQHLKKISSNLFVFQSGASSAEILAELLKSYEKIDAQALQRTGEECHVDRNYDFFYENRAIAEVISHEKKGVTYFYEDQVRPLIIRGKKSYLVMPRIVKRLCAYCGKSFSIDKLIPIDMWDEAGTRKVTKFSCPRHESLMKNFLGTTTLIQR